MKPKTEKENLLDDVLQGDSFDAYSSHLRNKSLLAFRRRRQFRQMRSGALGLLAIMLVGLFTFWTSENREHANVELSATSNNQQNHLPMPGPVPVPDENPLPATNDLHLSDAELLDLFPPGSCFLAEGDGRKILVFTDENVKREYFGR